MATALDQATRDAVMAEANARAQRFGISPEQALYNYARENNISNADVDTYMGYTPGSADAWVRQRDAANAVTHPNTPAPAYAGLSSTSFPSGIARAYHEWSAANGGDTPANQAAAQNYLSSLGINQNTIEAAYNAYQAPVSSVRQAPVAPAPQAQQPAPQGNSYTAPSTPAASPATTAARQPLYAGLSNNSSAADIAGAYREWSGANGGDTADNQRAAEGYLSSLGIGRGSILDAYTAYKGQSGASGGATGGGVGGAPSAAQPQPPRGIVESAMSQTLPTAGPTHWSVSPEMTVQGQLRTVMDSNSPLMQQARTQGLQVANERGLLNSSIAESAAMDSMYKAALPIAAADATTYAKSASENAGNATNITNSNTSAATSIANTAANNDTSRFNNAANNDTSRFNNAANNATTLAVNNSNNETSRANTAANNATTLATNAANNETSRANAKLQTDAAAALGLEESQYRKLAQGSSSAAQLMTNYQGQLSYLLRDQSFSDAETRQAAIDQLTNSTKAAIQMIGAMAGDLDIAAYMSQLFPAEEGKLAPALPEKW